MRRSGEARRERRTKFCLRVCFAYLLVCFRVSFTAVTVSPFLLSFSICLLGNIMGVGINTSALLCSDLCHVWYHG
jgi:hypothetical protein